MSAPQEYPDVLGIRPLAKIIDVRPETISRWITAGFITVNRLANRSVEIPVAGLRDFLPPAGDRLMSSYSARKKYFLTEHQLARLRRRGLVSVVQLPGGGRFRYLVSSLDARKAAGW